MCVCVWGGGGGCGGGGVCVWGGGGILVFSSYVGLDHASTVYQNIRHTLKIFEILSTKYS